MPRPDVSLGVASYHASFVDRSLSSTGFLDEAVRLGFQSVDLCDLSVGPSTAAELAARGLALTSIAIRDDFTDESRDLAAEVAHVLRWHRTAQELGAPLSRIWLGKGLGPRARARIEEALGSLLDAGLDPGRTVVETHGGWSGDVAYLTGLAQRSGLGVCVDYGNISAANRLADVAALAPWARHVHVKTYEFAPDGRDTTVDVEACTAILRDAGYAGAWVIEYEGEPPHDEGVRRTLDLLLPVLDRG